MIPFFKWALFDPTRRYRYALTRTLVGAEGPLGLRPDAFAITWVMLNPSTADAFVDDATLRRVRGFSADAGASWAIVCNLFARAATDPDDLFERRAIPNPKPGPKRKPYVDRVCLRADVVGPDNDGVIDRAAALSRYVICAWGANAARTEDARVRAHDVVARLQRAGRELRVLRIGADGQPVHPLREPDEIGVAGSSLYVGAPKPPAPWDGTSTATSTGLVWRTEARSS